jgi:3-oxoacyl-[acyl-carrier-protein] synthase-3
MAYLSFPNVRVVGMSACVPKEIDDNRTNPLISDEERDNLIASIGIIQKRRAPEGVTSSDLCYEAAEKLIADLQWDKHDVDALVFVSQTADYILPATACVLQDRLGLPTECMALDVSLGCSGWVYGMSTVSSLISNGSIKKALLLVGDLGTRTNSPRNRSDFPLFGDAGTCTALVFKEGAKGVCLHLGTDGSGKDAIIVPEGGYRHPFNEKTLEWQEVEGGYAQGIHARMDGMSVFSFAITKGPKSIKGLCERFGIDIEDVDCFVFHQANKLITDKIRKKLKIEEEKCPVSMDYFGNTSCATIPLTLVVRRQKELTSGSLKTIGCAFGVGLSWGSVYFETDKIIVPDLIEI